MAVGEFIGNGNPDGSSFGADTTDLISLYGVTPVAQRAGAAQAAVATTAITAVSTTASTSTSPYGYATTTQADAVVTAINSLITRVDAAVTLTNELQASLVALGAIKGAA